MDIDRELAISILKYLDRNKDFYFPFLVMCKEYTEEDNDFVEIEPSEWKLISLDKKYQTFQLWENLNNLDTNTTELLTKGFLDKIIGNPVELHISSLANNYFEEYTRRTNFSKQHKIEDYELNEFIRGKAEAYEECLELVRAKSFRII